MASFDLNAAQTVAAGGGSLPAAVGTGFGLPSCLLTLGMDVLKLIPSDALFGMRKDSQNAVALADDVVKSIGAQLRNIFGIIEWDSEEGGFTFVSNASKNGYDSGFFGGLNEAAAFLNGTAQFGAALWSNYQAGVNQINQIRDCFQTYFDYLKYKNGNAVTQLPADPSAYADYINSQFSVESAALNNAVEFIASATALIQAIDDTIAERVANPELEPTFTCEAATLFSGTGLATNCAIPIEEQAPIFRLVYGPPKSTFGQFVLSNDGIYFDSQSSGITPALVYLREKGNNQSKADKWKLKQSSNLGGRGEAFSTEDLKLYINTILDFNKIDDSDFLKPYYDQDGFLQELIGNRNKRIYDLSSQINQLETDNAPQAIIYNYKQSLLSENSNHLEKINKRKKQLELAVKLPRDFRVTYGTTTEYLPGEIPINDFTYLAGINLSLDLEKQKALTFSQVDIDTVISPIATRLPTVSRVFTKNSSLEHLIIPEVGDGAIIFDGSSVSATNAVILPTESFITTDGIIAMYNFLDTTIEDPSSTSFTLRNSASETNDKYAQLVATTQDFVFRGGLGIPYLQGITKNFSTCATQPQSLGSYVKIPNSPQFNDLLYSPNGASIDFWTYAPNLVDSTSVYNADGVSSLYRLILANENTGYAGSSVGSSEAIQNDFGDRSVRGLLLGFSRDRRLCSDLPPSNGSSDNPIEKSVFFIAPTQSTSPSSVGLINRNIYDQNNCVGQNRYHAMVTPLSSTYVGKAVSSCQSEFCYMAVSINPKEDKLEVYLDGQLINTSSLSYVFGIEKYQMPNIPTFKKSNSFEYSSSSVGASAAPALKFGPKLDTYFTPWIVGGGYTDGMALSGNFLGGQYGGLISGLRGYLGSLKFYSKPLVSSEILNNYKAHKEFFKNIDISNLT